jgi:ribosome-associated protein
MPPDEPPSPNAAKMIRLDQLLKLTGAAESGANAKHMVQDGGVKVNGAVETRRGRKLHVGDVVEVGGKAITIDDALLTRDD